MDPLICPGQICPETGLYVMVKPSGRATPYFRFVRAGDKMPPTAGPGMSYRLVANAASAFAA